VKEKFSPKFLKRERYINRWSLEKIYSLAAHIYCVNRTSTATHHIVVKLEEKWWGAKLPPLDVYEYLILKLEGAYMVKTNQL
jgi:hypothetical protein